MINVALDIDFSTSPITATTGKRKMADRVDVEIAPSRILDINDGRIAQCYTESILDVLNRLENDEDNLFSWKLTRSEEKFSLTVSCKLHAKTPNKAKDDNKVTRRTTVKPVKRCHRKKNRSPSALARSRKRHTRFLEKKLAGKPDLASPEEEQQDSDNSVCVKELENTGLACGSNRDLVSSENPTPSPAADPDLLNKQAILREFLDTIDSDDGDDDVSSVYSVCSNCKHPAKKGEDLKRCSRCHITRYFSVQCQRKD